MREKWKRAIVMAVCVSLGSQISISAFQDGFIITIAVVILGALMYEYNLLHPIPSGILVGLASPFFRGIMLFWRSDIADLGERLQWAWNWIYPECGFYTMYGICFALFYRNNRRIKNQKNYVFCLMFCDFSANMAELFIRNHGAFASVEAIIGLAAIAVCRATLISCILVSVNLYMSLLNKQDHEERYKRLMIMVSVFRSEIYFMNKNMLEIEDIMKKAFKMYRTMDAEGYPEEMKAMSLDISKDIHEIKKDYIRVIKGLQDNFLADFENTSMKIKDIVSILELDIKEQIEEQHLKVIFTASVKSDFMVEKHFAMMAILRNLANNSLDAVGEKKGGAIKLKIDEVEDPSKEGVYQITIRDNGSGIRQEDLYMVFDPGYSTKFDDETGDINRGVGLTLVRDLVREQFHGEIEVFSEAGRYTEFQIKLPRNYVEGA